MNWTLYPAWSVLMSFLTPSCHWGVFSAIVCSKRRASVSYVRHYICASVPHLSPLSVESAKNVYGPFIQIGDKDFYQQVDLVLGVLCPPIPLTPREKTSLSSSFSWSVAGLPISSLAIYAQWLDLGKKSWSLAVSPAPKKSWFPRSVCRPFVDWAIWPIFNTLLFCAGKVKLLLKELWLCINTTHRLPGEGSRCITGEREASRRTFHARK